jgi:hypothetical protein
MTERPAVSDALSIMATVAKDCYALDERGGQGVGDLFTEITRFTIIGQSFDGRTAITARLSRQEGAGLIHLAANPVVTIAGDTAVGTVDHLLLGRSGDGTLSPFTVAAGSTGSCAVPAAGCSPSAPSSFRTARRPGA